MSKLLRPSFFILGVQKGGTSTLHKYLSASEEIYFPFKKELHFFDAYYDKGWEWYWDKFMIQENSKFKVSGEATPYYFFHPFIPAKIYSKFPEGKFIVLLRNPVERAFSHYQMSARRGIEDRTFEEAIRREKKLIFKQYLRMFFDKRFNQIHVEKSYLSRGFYYKQAKRWLKYYRLDNFLFLKSEDLFNNPQETVFKVCDFLKVKRINVSEPEIINKGNYKDKISPVLYEEVARYFRKDVRKMSDLTGLKLDWFD